MIHIRINHSATCAKRSLMMGNLMRMMLMVVIIVVKREFDDMKIVINNEGNSGKKGNLMIWKLLLMMTMMMRDLNSKTIFMVVWDSLMNWKITKIITKFVISTIKQTLYRTAAHSICNLRYKGLIMNIISYSRSWQKNLRGKFECLDENTEKYMLFSLQITKENTNGKIIKYKIRFIGSVMFILSLLSSLTDNFAKDFTKVNGQILNTVLNMQQPMMVC